MKNSLGFPWHGSGFSSFFSGIAREVAYPIAGKIPLTAISAFFFLGIKTVWTPALLKVGAKPAKD
jgi:hypothetical protein